MRYLTALHHLEAQTQALNSRLKVAMPTSLLGPPIWGKSVKIPTRICRADVWVSIFNRVFTLRFLATTIPLNYSTRVGLVPRSHHSVAPHQNHSWIFILYPCGAVIRLSVVYKIRRSWWKTAQATSALLPSGMLCETEKTDADQLDA